MSNEESRSRGPIGTGRLSTSVAAAGQAAQLISDAQTHTARIAVQRTGFVWWVSLNNDQTQALEKALHVVAAAADGLAIPEVGLAIEAAIPYIEAMNKLGGYNGVDINGVIGTLGVIVTPRVGQLYGELIQAARLAVSGRTILDFIVMASSKVPALGATLGIPAVAAVFAAVAAGTPIGWAIAGGVGLLVNLFEPAPDPNAHGTVRADRNQVGDWETFWVAQLGDQKKVALLSWIGNFSAQGGGGQGVYANRPQVGEWETWTWIDHADGTVSLQTSNGHFLCAEEGGGRECQANRTSISNWEKFIPMFQPNGKVALKTHDKGLFVSVQP